MGKLVRVLSWCIGLLIIRIFHVKMELLIEHRPDLNFCLFMFIAKEIRLSKLQIEVCLLS